MTIDNHYAVRYWKNSTLSPVAGGLLRGTARGLRHVGIGIACMSCAVGDATAQEGIRTGEGEASVVSTADLIAEIPALINFNLFVFEGDTTPTLSVPAEPPPSLHLSALQQELRFALLWLLEGAPSYDRAGTLSAHPGDSAAMRRTLFAALQGDETFTRPVLELATPLLRARGVRVTDGPAHDPVNMTERDVLALAARFIQLTEDGNGITVCAKPHLLRGVRGPRHAAVEAWIYSAVRSAMGGGQLMRVAGQALSSAQNMSRDEMERHMWTALEESEALRTLIADLELRSHGWAPVLVQR